MSEKNIKQKEDPAIPCPACYGQGYIWRGEDTVDCPTCKGRGVIER